MEHYNICLDLVDEYQRLNRERKKLILELRLYFFLSVLFIVSYFFIREYALHAGVLTAPPVALLSYFSYDTFKTRVKGLNIALRKSLDLVFEYQDAGNLESVQKELLNYKTMALTSKPITILALLGKEN